MRSLKMVQFRHARNVPFRLLMIIGIIAFTGGLSPAEAKHDGWGHPDKHGWGIRASIRAGTSTVGEIRVGTWAGISTHGSITAGSEVPALARSNVHVCTENGRWSVPCHAGQARRWPLAQADDNQGLTRGGDPKQVSSFHLSLGSERWCWKCRRSSQFDHMRRPQSAEPSRTLFAADVGIRPARAEYLGESHLSEAAPSMRREETGEVRPPAICSPPHPMVALRANCWRRSASKNATPNSDLLRAPPRRR